ncbi:LacI family transcriptional regulator [Roseibium hamelinense]|uniref:LacI family transcriptional regulator n=1 Tax=Roseibium hamelinense TaxID=150831 RepID=A0A562SYY2_9HYPH|nr:substrate-binding domain-containing protein [Roseibium hamelinense]MTI44900.1 LacI family DNA-binding transcriptional regulator [Roseibium hamelinense]TWI85906.1 LacI family transcriptional regulator [Roseibium hamelinense]
MVNLKELSKALELSQTTVSRALNGYPEVSAKTRDRVVEMARQLGYEPNLQARRLATGRSMAIGHVIPRSVHDMMNPIFLEFIAGAGQTYATHGYDMIISVVEDNNEEDAFREIASRKKADGVILQGPRINDRRHDLLDQLGLPFVVHGRITGAEERTSWIDVNNRRAFERATNLLIDLGHKRIALINGLETMDFAVRRRTGYETALQAHGLEPDQKLMSSADMTEPYGAETAIRLLKSQEPPTAFLVSSMISAIGVARGISLCGLRIGKDVSVITHDDALSFLPNSGEVPIFTCTRSSVRYAGIRAAEMIIQKVNEEGDEHAYEHLEAELILGQSTGPAP